MSNMEDGVGVRKDAPSVLPIDRRTVHQICSGQVVLNLATAMKELLENSLDAGARSVDIKLKENGAELIEVCDDGHGVEPQNFEALTLKHHTSKIRDFSDLTAVETFGFRGEALSSLCALSNLSITTRHESQMAGTKIEYDHSGKILSKTPCARQVGTTVTLANLFSTLPVRHKEFQRNIKKEFVKLVHVLNGYCLISSCVRINCTNLVGKGKKMTIVSTTGGDQIRDNITCVFGAKQVQTLIPFKQTKPSEEEINEYNIQESQSSLYQVTGFISKADHGLGRSSADRQFFYINKRPCDLVKVSRVVNEVYHMFNRHQYPFIMLDISLQRDAVDVNVTPDKRQVFMQEEKLLLAIIKSSLKRMFDTGTSSYEVNQKPLSQLNLSFIKNDKQTTENKEKNESQGSSVRSLSIQAFPSLKSFKRPFSSIASDSDVNRKPKQVKLTSFSQETELKRKDEVTEISGKFCADFACEERLGNTAKNDSTVDLVLDDEVQIIEQENAQGNGRENVQVENSKPDADGLSMETVPNNKGLLEIQINKEGKENQNLDRGNENGQEEDSKPDADGLSVETVPNNKGLLEIQINKEGKENQNLDHGNENGQEEDSKPDAVGLSVETVPNNTSLPNVEDNPKVELKATVEQGIRTKKRNLKEIVKTRKTLHIDFNIEKLKDTRISRKIQQKLETAVLNFRAKISPENNTAAEEELTKNITKESFAKMEILGQFNLGFILTKLGEDLFIIDQHASDEKYNFEYQQKNTSLNSQKLIVPKNLDLTASSESVLIDNIDIFRKNGFEFEIDERAEATKKARLVSVPVSKNWTFGVEDVEELLFMLSDSPGVMCRPTRVRKMFASRACRMSIMVGTALSRDQMRTVVNHMGEMDHPWNCPHGRPTMRHVINLNMVAGGKGGE